MHHSVFNFKISMLFNILLRVMILLVGQGANSMRGFVCLHSSKRDHPISLSRKNRTVIDQSSKLGSTTWGCIHTRDEQRFGLPTEEKSDGLGN